MKGKKIHKNSSEKLFAFVVFTIASILGLIYAMNPNALSSLVVNRNYKATDNEPYHYKGLSDNGDGTYKLSLEVKGESEVATHFEGRANVLVVYDTSSSMTRYRANGGNSGPFRADAAEKVIYDFAQNIFSKQDNSDPTNIQMALVTFNSYSNTVTKVDWTSDKSKFDGDLLSSTGTNGSRKLSYAQGTNWEAALNKAIDVLGTADADDTYVIFVTDGEPSSHGTSNGADNQWYSHYLETRDEGQEIAQFKTADNTEVNTTFYGVYAYGSQNDYLDDLMYYSYHGTTIPEGTTAINNYYNASDTASLTTAIQDIFEQISNKIGIANVSINDGTTHNVSTTSGKIANLLEVDQDSFKYYKNNVEWTDAPRADYNPTTGEVEWDLTSLSEPLDNNVTYKVTFDVYPSQYTYDIVSEMKNGDLAWLSLDANIRQYLDVNGNLKTNTSATLHYEDTRTDEGPQEADFNDPDPVETETFKIGAHKEWVNLLDDKKQKDKDLLLTVTRDGAAFHKVTLNNSNNYTINTTGENGIHIAPGLMKIVTDKNGNKSVKLLDSGHDYTFAELDGDYYNWDIKAKTIRPMIIDGHLHNLILVDENLLAEHPEYAVPTGMGSNTYYQENTNAPEFVKINGKTYVIQSGDSITVDATNNRRSNLNIVKKVDGADAPKDAKFDFSITVTDDGIADNDKIYLTVFDTNKCDAATGDCAVIDLKDVVGWEKETNANGWAGYYMAPSGTEFKAQLQDGWNVLVTNLTDQASYVITEGDANGNLPEHFVFAADKSKVSAENNNGNITNPALVYTINGDEKTISGDIDRDNASYTVQVTNVYELVDIEVNKVWEDNGNQDGKRPQNGAVFHLYANGNDTGQTTTRKDDGKVSFTGLDRFDSKGKLITYTVVEDKVDEYTTTPADATDSTKGVSDGTTVTNKHVPEVIDVSVTKEWDDNNNQDGKRGNGAVFHLYADGKDTGEKKTIATDGTVKFEGLTKYKEGSEGVEIVYTIVEDALTGYTTTPADATDATKGVKDGATVTNSHDLETTSVSVTKKWEDHNNQDGKRGNGAVFHLYADGKDTGEKKTIATDGTVKFEGLTKYKEGSEGVEIVYTIVEDALTGYTTTPAGAIDTTKGVKDGATITNKHDLETTDVSVTKKWEDHNNQDGKRGNGAVFHLYADGKDTGEKKTIATDGTVKFEGLTKYKEGEEGVEIVYTIVEDALTGYTTTPAGAIDTTKGVKDGATITNKHDLETTDVSVTKKWDDHNNQDGKRGNGAVFHLYADGKDTGEKKTIATDGTVKFEGLTKYKEGSEGVEIVYTIVEDALNGYTTTPADATDTTKGVKDGATVTNKHTPEEISVEITKIWDDNSNQDGKRGDLENFHLYADGVDITDDTPRGYAESEDGNTWHIGFDELPKYKDGVEIKYTVVEDKLDGYTTTPVEATDKNKGVKNGATITNKHELDTISVSVTKKWEDNNNQDNSRGEGAVFHLYADGKDTGEKKTIAIDGTVKFEGLIKNKAGEVNVPIKYTIVEEAIDGYETSPKVALTNGVEDGTTITNSHDLETTSISVTKKWEDNNNQDNSRGNGAVFHLYADGVDTGEKKTIAKDGTVTFEDLTKFRTGEVGVAIVYTIVEDAIDGYTTTPEDATNPKKGVEDGTMITNKHDLETTSVSVTKKWEDGNDQDGLRKDGAVFHLYADGKDTGEKKTIAKDGTVTFEDLTKYKAGSVGVEITYTVVEEAMAGYTTTPADAIDVTKGVKDGVTVTNSHTPITTSITVTKEWRDKNNQDGYRSKVNAKVQLWKMVDGKAAKVEGEKAVPVADGNVYVYENLPVFEKGNPITYYVEESMNKVEGKDVYNVTGDDTELVAKEGDSGTIALVNTHTPDTISIEKGYKVWKDTNNQDGMRPDYIIVNVNSDAPNAQNPVKTVRVDGNLEGDTLNRWSYSVKELPRYRDQGQEIHYSVTESYPDNFEYAKEYTFSIDKDDKYTIINTHNTKTTEVEVTKKWEDTEDQDGLRPEKITLTLYANGDEVPEYTNVEVLPKDGNKMNNTWSYTFTGLDMYSEGEAIVYTVAETPATEGYNVNTVYSNNNYNAVITNTHTPSKLTIKGTKVWDDNTDKDVMRPDYINIRLTKNGKATDNVQKVTAEENWSFTFSNLDEFENHGEKIVYGVQEEYPEDYEFTNLYQVDISDVTKEEVNQKETDDTEEPSESEEPTVKENNYIITVTNKYVPEYVSIIMNKIWEDENNNDGIRPQYITVNLLADGEVIKSEKVTEANGWKVAFTDLPKYKNHKEVIYTITEDVVENYKSIIIVNNDNTEFTITNQHDPEKTKISGTKTWQDDEKNLDKRPSTITIKLYADGVYLQTITVSNQTNWQYLIDNLYKYKNGKEITYTIVEDEVEDYTSVVNGFDITNIYTGGTGEVVPPNTGIELETNTNYEIKYLYMFLATIALGSLKRRFNN